MGCIIIDKYGRTNIKGVFAAGSCTLTIKDIVPSYIGDSATVSVAARIYLSYIF